MPERRGCPDRRPGGFSPSSECGKSLVCPGPPAIHPIRTFSMKNFCLSLFAALLIAVSFDPAPRSAARGVSVSPNIVISQIYGGGGNSASSQFANDFVE